MVLREVVLEFGRHSQFTPSNSDLRFLEESLRNWQPFLDTVDSLKQLADKFKLATISNIDDDMFAYSVNRLQVTFDYVITAESTQSYKPSHNNFNLALDCIEVTKGEILNVVQNVYHNIVPAKLNRV